MFVVGSDEDDVETIDATAEFALKHDIDSVQFMILTPIPGSPDWDTLYAKGDKYVINRNWTFYDGHHAVHQPRRMSPYELQLAAINGMAKFYSWRGIMKKLLKGDLYYTTIRYWGKKMIREWWKDEENRAYVDWLRGQLYADARELGHASVQDDRAAGRAAAGQARAAAAALPGRARRDGGAAGRGGRGAMEGATTRAREAIDCLITPIVKRAEQGKEEFYAHLASASETLQRASGTSCRRSPSR